MKILVKLPSRERPEKLIQRIEEYKAMSHDKSIKYLVSLDENDLKCNNEQVLARLKELSCIVYVGHSKNKIDACNRDIDKVNGWDILVLASDDMECVQQDWDNIIKMEMEVYFPDTDGVLFHWDGDNNTRYNLNTMCILGKKYYDRFSYIYNPNYISLWADNEFTEIADILNKQYRSDIVLFKHVHFSNTHGVSKDELMTRTQSYYHIDGATFKRRKQLNFNI